MLVVSALCERERGVCRSVKSLPKRFYAGSIQNMATAVTQKWSAIFDNVFCHGNSLLGELS
jgi:hypothetical protein